MTVNELYEELNFVSAARENRLMYSKMVLDDMSLFPKLIEILFMVDDKKSSKAAWIFEYVCNDYIYAIIPHLDIFTTNLKRVHLDSSVRPIARVCEMIAKAYCSKQNKTMKNALQNIHKERIIEACFDWMISNQKVAVKAYSMDTLYLLGKEYNWVHPELKQILQQDYTHESAGFKARAKHVLKKIKDA